MRPYPRIKLDTNPVEFYCPHCETVIVTDSGNEHKPIPTECPNCKGMIDNTGVQPYKDPIKK